MYYINQPKYPPACLEDPRIDTPESAEDHKAYFEWANQAAYRNHINNERDASRLFFILYFVVPCLIVWLGETGWFK